MENERLFSYTKPSPPIHQNKKKKKRRTISFIHQINVITPTWCFEFSLYIHTCIHICNIIYHKYCITPLLFLSPPLFHGKHRYHHGRSQLWRKFLLRRLWHHELLLFRILLRRRWRLWRRRQRWSIHRNCPGSSSSSQISSWRRWWRSPWVGLLAHIIFIHYCSFPWIFQPYHHQPQNPRRRRFRHRICGSWSSRDWDTIIVLIFFFFFVVGVHHGELFFRSSKSYLQRPTAVGIRAWRWPLSKTEEE